MDTVEAPTSLQFKIACVCKGTLKYWYPLGHLDTEFRAPQSENVDSFYSFCPKCKNPTEN